MEIKKGIGVSPGFATAKVLILSSEDFVISRTVVGKGDIRSEVKRYEKAVEEAVAHLRAQLEHLSKKIGESTANIIEGHIALMRDKQFRTEVAQLIEEQQNSAEYAVSKVIQKKLKMMSRWGEAFFVQRVQQDLGDIERMLIRNLLGKKLEDLSHLKSRVVLVAHDLGPSQTISLDRSKVAGILTDKGGRTSHTAIVASSLGIPAVVGLESITTEVIGGDTVILDGSSGTVIIHPDEETVKRYAAMERNFIVTGRRLAKELHDLPAETKDGVRIEIVANIELPEDIPDAIAHGAEGIGLYRTEFLYLNTSFNPTEGDHINAYTKALSLAGKRRLVIRTLDLGADKMPVDGMPAERNPFLGTRAIRLCFQQMDMFKAQLRAILKVSSFGDVAIMFPMVATVEEVIQIREILQEVKSKMKAAGEAYNEQIPLGIMIEVPSAALTIDILANHVDFFSIGTNDLIAYSMAVDRANEKVASLYQPAHPAILRMLKNIIDIGNRKNKRVSVCGEMSSDMLYTLLLLGMGLKIFSVVPPAVTEVKKIIRSVTMKEAKAVADKAMTFSDSRRTIEFLRERTQAVAPELF